MCRKTITWVVMLALMLTAFSGLGLTVGAEADGGNLNLSGFSALAAYEAEDSGNELGGGAAITGIAGASESSAVSLSAADGGSVKINNINAAASGGYSLIIYYAAAETVTAGIQVNSAGAGTVEFASTTSGAIGAAAPWEGQQSSVAVPVSLTEGNNTIQLTAQAGTVILDKIVLEEQTSSFEAESPSNSLLGGAGTSDNSNASGGKQVNNISQSGGVNFENINIEHTGKYILTLYYSTKDPRNFKLIINNGEPIRVDCPSTSPDNWDTVGAYEVTVNLDKGKNTISIFSYDYGPNLDRIALNTNAQQDLPPYPAYEGTLYEAEAGGNIIEGDVKDNIYASGGKYVVNLGNKSLTFSNIAVEQDGYYKVAVLYSVGDNTRSFNLSVNDGAPIKISTPSTQFWDKIGKAETVVSLKAGSNKLKFDNAVTGWAPNLDAIAVAPGASAPPEAAAGDTYEAESAVLGNGAEIQGNSKASGSEQAGNIGSPSRNGFVLFDNVSAEITGSYTMSVYYVSGSGDRAFDVSVNGEAPVRLACPKSGDDWATVGRLDMEVVLNAGKNTVRFDNASWYAPNLDRIMIDDVPAVYEAEASQNILGGNAGLSLNSKASSGVQIGNLGGDQNGSLKFAGIYVNQSGDYLMKVDYSSGSDRAFDVSVNELPALRLDCPAVINDDWETIGSVYMAIPLTKGMNTVKFDNKSGYSPNLDRISITKGIYSYEAEDRRNTLAGGAAVSGDSPEDSGRRHVGNLGGGGPDYGSVQFNNIHVPEEGIYKLTGYYISGSDDRYFKVSVNNSPEVRLNCPNSGGWSSVGKIETLIPLREGVNTIKFNSDYYAPNLDRIEISQWPQSYEAEDPSNTLGNGASIDSNPKDSGGKHAGGLGDGFVRFDHVNVNRAGAYKMTFYYISGSDDRSFDISVNGAGAVNIPCPKSDDDWSESAAAEVTVNLLEGENTIKFSKEGWYAPNLDRIEIATDVVNPVKEADVTVMTNGNVRIEYDLNKGAADFYYKGVKKVSGFYSAIETNGPENTFITSKDYTSRNAVTTGNETVITSAKAGYPTMKQKFILDGNDHFLVQVTLEGAGLSSNWMSPVMTDGAGSVDIGSYDDNRALFVPFDNDAWVRYDAGTINREDLSYEVGAFYNNSNRNGLVIGSVDHDTWKTGVYFRGTDNRLDKLYAFGGAASAFTRDAGYHGSITGNVISSPRIFVGYSQDWRNGMEEYAAANAYVVPKQDWKGSVPFGWNSWGKIQSSINFEKAAAVSNFVHDELQNYGFSNDNTVYINLDSYWDNMNDGQLADFVKVCKNNGQKAGIYWAPFVDWGKNQSRQVEGSSYTYKDIWLKDSKGNPIELDGAYALDPTHPGTKARIDYFINRFKQAGFEYIKLDFLTHASIEGGANNGVHYDTNVHTGIQAYNQGMAYVNKKIGGQMFISLAISPVFPYQYANARRVACDSYGSASETEYTMNSVSYGWWMSGILYEYNDPDHMVLEGHSADENMSRITSGVAAGTVFLNGDDLTGQAGREKAKQYLTNSRVNEVAKIGKPFVPVETNSGRNAADTFVLKDGNAFYIALFNYGGSNAVKSLNLARAGLNGSARYDAQELWSGTKIQGVTATLETKINAGGAKLYKLTPAAAGGPSGGSPSTGTQPVSSGGSKGIVSIRDDSFIKDIKEALDNGSQETIKLKVSGVEGAEGYSVSIPAQALILKENILRLEIQTEFGTVIVPSNLLASAGIQEGSEIALNIKAVTEGTADKRKPVVEVTVNAGGKPIEYDNPYSAMTVRIPYAPSAEELEDQEYLVILSIDGEGRSTPVSNGRFKADGGVMEFRASHPGRYAVAFVRKSFSDTAQAGWAEKPVRILAAKGIIASLPEQSFNPGAAISRGEFLNWLIKSLDLKAEFDSNFSDMDETDANYKAVGVAKALGITAGIGNSRFDPAKEISRQDMMVLGEKALKIAGKALEPGAGTELEKFSDADAMAAYAREAAAALVRSGYIAGSGSRLNPSANATRAEAAVLVYKIYANN